MPGDLTPNNGTVPEQVVPETPQVPDSEPTPQPEPVTPTVDPVPPAEPEVDWKGRATEQARENIVLDARNKELLAQLNARRELTNDPTEAELRGAFPEWDEMTPTEQKLAKGNLVSQRIAEKATTALKTREERDKWDNDLDMAITANPALQGREADFKRFANKPTHRGVSTEILVKAFLHDEGAATPAPKPTTRQVLEPGSGGPRESVTPKDSISAEELSVIRKTDPKRYREILSSGKSVAVE